MVGGRPIVEVVRGGEERGKCPCAVDGGGDDVGGDQLDQQGEALKLQVQGLAAAIAEIDAVVAQPELLAANA